MRIDAGINLALGALLIVFPSALVEFLGIPGADSAFYPNVLGGVLSGIGVALWIESRHQRVGPGLGVLGAAAINLCGGAVVLAWLIFGELGLSTRGNVVLGLLVALLVVLSVLELTGRSRN